MIKKINKERKRKKRKRRRKYREGVKQKKVTKKMYGQRTDKYKKMIKNIFKKIRKTK